MSDTGPWSSPPDRKDPTATSPSPNAAGTPLWWTALHCKAEFAVEVRDLDSVQPLLVALVDAGANEIDGVDFDVTGKQELRAEARREAVAAARGKAELYAEAEGVHVGEVVHIEDVDPEALNVQYRGHGGSGSAAGDDLAPGHVVVSAAVLLGFAISR